MTAAIICAVLAVICLTQGAVQGAVALGILAAILYFMFGSKTSSAGSKTPAPKPQEKKEPQPDNQYRATPSMVVHYKGSPVVAQIAREICARGAQVSVSFAESGDKLTARGAGFYEYIFKDHGYQKLSVAEQEAFLIALISMFPYSQSYEIGYTHREKSTVPLHYSASTKHYKDYHWDKETGTWKPTTKL